jgi:hypothetical protein
MTEITVPAALEVPVNVDDNEFSLADLYDPRSKYSAEQKVAAAMSYVKTGNSKWASQLCGIPDETIRWWKASASWWPDAITKCRRLKRDDLDGACNAIIDKALNKIEDAVENGETIVSRDGNLIQKPVSARDLTIIAATLFDKQNLIRGEPTSLSERRDRSEVMKDLLSKFQELSDEIRKDRTIKVVSEQ